MRQLLHLPFRMFSTTATHVDKNLLSKLRKQTGVPFINCKKALAQFDNDFDQAKKWLLEEAQREGWTRATKLQSRPMSQGLVAVLATNQQATMIEVNCETDFVAKNEKFVAMVTKLVEECSGYFQKRLESEVCLTKADLGEIQTPDQGSLADIVSLNIGNLGENMALRRGIFMRKKADNHRLSCYVHPSGGGNEFKSLMLGKYGAMVELFPLPPNTSMACEETTLGELGRELCQHIVGMNPQSVGEYVPDTTVSQPASTDTGIVDQGYGSDASSEDGDEAPTQLLQQEFLLDPSVCVGEMLEARGGLGVLRFKRFACGEEIDGEGEE